jgi:hypothetical protein
MTCRKRALCGKLLRDFESGSLGRDPNFNLMRVCSRHKNYFLPCQQVSREKSYRRIRSMESRGINKDAWMASVFGPRKPWVQGFAQFMGWNPCK